MAIGLTTLTGPGVALAAGAHPASCRRARRRANNWALHRACVLRSRLSCNDFLMHRRVVARDDHTAAAGATVGKGGRPVCCGRRGFWDGSQLRDGPVVAGPDGPLRRRHRPPGADETNTDLAKATATDGNTNDHDLGRSCCAENDEPLVELGVRCLWVVCFGYCRVRGMVAPRSWNARRWVSVGWASVGTVLSVPAKWTWLRVRVPRWVSSPW